MTWATSNETSVFLRLSVLDLGHIYATDKRPKDRQKSETLSLMPRIWGRTITKSSVFLDYASANNTATYSQLHIFCRPIYIEGRILSFLTVQKVITLLHMFRHNKDAISVALATASWLGRLVAGWLAGCHTPVLYVNSLTYPKTFSII